LESALHRQVQCHHDYEAHDYKSAGYFDQNLLRETETKGICISVEHMARTWLLGVKSCIRKLVVQEENTAFAKPYHTAHASLESQDHFAASHPLSDVLRSEIE
jgi:hypothetical protein